MVSQEEARAIMSANMFGIKEVARHFGINPTMQQILAIIEIPWSEKVLGACKDTHILVAVFPLSILDIRDRVDRRLFRNHENAWYNDQELARDTGTLGWQLVRREPVVGSISRTLNEQQALLPTDEDIPKARVIVYTTIGNFLANGKWLFSSHSVRCSDIYLEQYPVDVGVSREGLSISYYWDDDSNSEIGLAAAKKPPLNTRLP